MAVRHDPNPLSSCQFHLKFESILYRSIFVAPLLGTEAARSLRVARGFWSMGIWLSTSSPIHPICVGITYSMLPVHAESNLLRVLPNSPPPPPPPPPLVLFSDLLYFLYFHFIFSIFISTELVFFFYSSDSGFLTSAVNRTQPSLFLFPSPLSTFTVSVFSSDYSVMSWHLQPTQLRLIQFL